MRFIAKALVLAACMGAAQQTPPNAGTSDRLDLLVKAQFGSTFVIPTEFPKVLITADFDGDGVEDAVIVANSKDPLPDSYGFKYEVADPYNGFFGMGNPMETTKFGGNDPRYNHDLLVIFGAGPEGWRSATPKAKFVIINVPFDTIEVGRILLKKNKPPVFVIRTIESEIMDSNVFWDVKKKRWKWQPGGMK